MQYLTPRHFVHSCRQKIDEAPTPFRYHSESDQSECESDGERLARRDLEDAADAAASNSPRDPQTNKKKSLPTNPHSVGDSWEAINAKLQYEKHLQDSVGATNPSMMLGKPNDSLLRSQFYQHSGSNSNNNFGSHTHSQTGSPRVSMAGSAKIQDLQSNFGEILNPAPAAFSPQFTNKNFRRANGSGSSSATKASILVAGSASADDESGGAGSGAGMHGSEGPSPKRKPLTPEKPPKSVFIKAFAEGEGQGHGEGHGHGEEAIGGNTDAMGECSTASVRVLYLTVLCLAPFLSTDFWNVDCVTMPFFVHFTCGRWIIPQPPQPRARPRQRP